MARVSNKDVRDEKAKVRVGITNRLDTGEPQIILQVRFEDGLKHEIMMGHDEWVEVVELLNTAIDEIADTPMVH